MSKKIKIVLLILEVLGIVISLIFRKFLLMTAMILALIYSLYILFKWKNMKMKNQFILRTFVASDLILLCFFILLFRMIQIQLFDYENYKTAVQNQVSVKIEEDGERGDIFDCNGKGLAYSINMYELSVDPKRFITTENSFEALKELVNKGYIKENYNQLKNEIEKLGEAGRRYKKLNKDIDDVEKKEIDKILEEYKLQRKNVIFLPRRKERRYYRKDMYFFLVGNVGFKKGTEKEGTFGLEKFYEPYLKGEKMSKVIQGIRKLGVGLPTSKPDSKVNLDGMNLHLTVDNDIQYILNDELEKQFIKTNAEQSYGIIMDPNNGKILATAFFRKDKNNVTNPIFQAQVEPGSIFKPLIVAAGINEKKFNRYTTFDVGNGTIRKYNHTIRESSRSTKGILKTEDILKKSSNVGMVLVGDKFTNTEFDSYLEKYGFYEKTGVDYPYEKLPKRVPVKQWNGLKKSTMSFGQGIAVTPIQMITAFSAVINGGHLYKPYIVEKITDKDGLVVKRNLPVLRRDVIRPEVSKEMRDILELVVEEGTVKKAKVEGYRLGGKTGTAQFSEHGKYVFHEYLSSVMGFFPADKPKYIVLLMFFRPQGEILYDKFGGTAAAPALGQIVRRITKLKNMSSTSVENIKIEKNQTNSQNTIVSENLNVMPDLKGMSARDVMEMFRGKDIELSINGVGNVISQEPKANTDMTDIKKVKVELKQEKK